MTLHRHLNPKMICGKCRNFVEECTCEDLTVLRSQTDEEKRRITELTEQAIEFDKFRASFEAKTTEHRVKTDDKRKLCSACKTLGSTFGCLKCNRGTTKVSW
jgi:hypothetical protein